MATKVASDPRLIVTPDDKKLDIVRKEIHSCGGIAIVKPLKSPYSTAVAQCLQCDQWWNTTVRE